MAINFNQNSAWNLKPISVESVRDEVNGLLIRGGGGGHGLPDRPGPGGVHQ